MYWTPGWGALLTGVVGFLGILGTFTAALLGQRSTQRSTERNSQQKRDESALEAVCEYIVTTHEYMSQLNRNINKVAAAANFEKFRTLFNVGFFDVAELNKAQLAMLTSTNKVALFANDAIASLVNIHAIALLNESSPFASALQAVIEVKTEQDFMELRESKPATITGGPVFSQLAAIVAEVRKANPGRAA